jgi:hypothetical protein
MTTPLEDIQISQKVQRILCPHDRRRGVLTFPIVSIVWARLENHEIFSESSLRYDDSTTAFINDHVEIEK